MLYILVFVVCFATALFSDMLPLIKSLQDINSLVSRIVYAFRSKYSTDYRNERLMKWYALRLFLASTRIVFYLLIIVLGAYLLLLLASGFILPADCNVFRFIITLQGGIISILAFVVYYLFKRVYAKFRL